MLDLWSIQSIDDGIHRSCNDLIYQVVMGERDGKETSKIRVTDARQIIPFTYFDSDTIQAAVKFLLLWRDVHPAS